MASKDDARAITDVTEPWFALKYTAIATKFRYKTRASRPDRRSRLTKEDDGGRSNGGLPSAESFISASLSKGFFCRLMMWRKCVVVRAERVARPNSFVSLVLNGNASR